MPRHSERHFFTNDDGLKLAAIVEYPENESRGVILFSHCFTCSKDLKTIVKLSRKLADMGWTNCRYDFRGIGQSEGVFSESNFTTNLVDLASATKWLESLNLAPQFLFGHSFGGAASLAVAGELPERLRQNLRGIITLAAPSETAHLADILLAMNPQIASGEGKVSIGGKEFSITTQMLDNFRSIDFTTTVSELQKSLNLPHLILHSLADKTVAYRHAKQLFQLLTMAAPEATSSDVSLYTMNTADHLLAENPDDIARVSMLLDLWCEQRLDH